MSLRPPIASLEARRLSNSSLRLETIHAPTRIVIMGKSGVGKTAIVKRLLDGKFVSTYQPTVEDMYSYTSNAQKKLMEMEILDTSGFYSFPAMKDIYFQTGKAFVLVYSYDQKDSFQEVCHLRQQIIEEKKKRMENDYFIFVVSNKCDLSESCNSISEYTTVSKWPRAQILKTSAKDNTHIKTLFELVHKTFFVDVDKYRKGSKVGLDKKSPQLKKKSGENQSQLRRNSGATFSKKFRRSIRRMCSKKNRNRNRNTNNNNNKGIS